MRIIFLFILATLAFRPTHSTAVPFVDVKPPGETTDSSSLPLKPDTSNFSHYEDIDNVDLFQEELPPFEGLKDAFDRYTSDVFRSQKESTPSS